MRLRSIDVEYVGGFGADAGYSPRIRQRLSSNKFDINDWNIDDTIGICIDYNESKGAYYCKFVIKSKDISNYDITPNQDFKKNGSARMRFPDPFVNIRNWKMKLNFDKFRYYYAMASPNCECNDNTAAGCQI